ncbi:hypothetical protein QF018_005803, partial [Pseudomonas laurylsulfatiphila]
MALIAGKPAPTVNVWIPETRKSMGIAWISVFFCR